MACMSRHPADLATLDPRARQLLRTLIGRYIQSGEPVGSQTLARHAGLDELWRRIAYSILITNTDDHLMNHGFLYAGHGRWRLAPAFDVNPSADRVRELKTWISPETGPAARVDALMSVARYFRLDDRAPRILEEVEAAVATWREEARNVGMTDAEVDSFTDAFEHEERAVARSLAAT